MKRFATQVSIALIGASFLMSSSIAGGRTVYSDDGISELSAPDNWSVRADIGRTAALRVSNVEADYHLAVYTYLPDEIEPATLAEFSESFSKDLMENMEDARMSSPVNLTINGRPAVQYEISGRIGEDRFVYLSTTVEGERAKHQLVATTNEADFKASQGALREAIMSFRESAKRRAAKERIELVFNWPERAKSQFTMRNKNTDRRGTHEMQLSGVTTVRPLKGEGLLVSTQVTDFKMTSSEKDEAKQNYLQNLLQEVTSGMPDYVVSKEGEFVRIENLGAYYGRIEKALLKGLPGDPGEAQEKAKNLIKSLISEETLKASMEDGWNKQVYDWAGGSYAVGENYTYETQYQLPTLGEAVFPMAVSQQLAGRVPCHEKDKAKTCVRLVLTTRISGAAFDQAMQQYLNKMVRETLGDKQDLPDIAVDGAEIVKTVTLVTDPATLLPYEENESEIKTTRVNVGGRKQTGKDVTETVTRYTY